MSRHRPELCERLRMMHHSVIARHDSAEAISVGQRIATHLSGARNDKKRAELCEGLKMTSGGY
jgi:hypothetical protein